MPSGQILYLMMFVGKCSCTSHVLQYSSSSSYEHSRSPQSILCPGVVTVLICSFFVAALLLIYINLKNGGKIIHIFTNHQILEQQIQIMLAFSLMSRDKIDQRSNFSYLFAIIFEKELTLYPQISSNNGKEKEFRLI